MAAMGFAGRVVVRWQRFAELTLAGCGASGRAIVRAAYMRGVRDALDSISLAERERLIAVHRTQSAKNEQSDAILSHAAVNEGVRRCMRQLDAFERSADGLGVETRRLARLRAELAYLLGEARPDVLSLAGPARRVAHAGAGPELRLSQSTEGDDDAGFASDPRREWYADDKERADQLREQASKQLRPVDDEAGED